VDEYSREMPLRIWASDFTFISFRQTEPKVPKISEQYGHCFINLIECARNLLLPSNNYGALYNSATWRFRFSHKHTLAFSPNSLRHCCCCKPTAHCNISRDPVNLQQTILLLTSSAQRYSIRQINSTDTINCRLYPRIFHCEHCYLLSAHFILQMPNAPHCKHVVKEF